MRAVFVGLYALAVVATACGQEVFLGAGNGPCAPPPDIVIPGSGYSSYLQVFPPGCCQSTYAQPFPPGFGYPAYGRIIPTPGIGCNHPLPLPTVPLFAEKTPPPASPPPAASPER